MFRMGRWIATCAVGSLVCLASGPALRSSSPQVLAPDAIERALFESINQERAVRDLPLLEISTLLSDVARAHSEEMARLGRLTHESTAGGTLKERLERARIANALNAENVARGLTSDPALIHEALMKSEGHRENILLPGVDEVGIGVVRGPDGVFYVTEDFLRSVAWLDEAAARQAVIGVLEEVRRSRGRGPLAIFEEISRKAQDFARLKAEGRGLPPIPSEFGEVRVDFYIGVELEGVAAKIRERDSERYGVAGIGVHIGPAPGFPAGAYQVCIFLLTADTALLTDEGARVGTVLQAVNEVRALKKKSPLALDAALGRRADALAERYLKERPPLGEKVSPGVIASLADPPAVGAAFIIYETSDLKRLALDLHRPVQSIGGRKVGISVKPAGPGLTVIFVVVLVFES